MATRAWRATSPRAGLGYTVVTWGVVGADWAEDDGAAIAGRILGGLHPGAIVLLHDTLASFTAEACRDRGPMLAAVEAVLAARPDWRFLTVPGLLALGPPRRRYWIQSTDAAYLAGCACIPISPVEGASGLAPGREVVAEAQGELDDGVGRIDPARGGEGARAAEIEVRHAVHPAVRSTTPRFGSSLIRVVQRWWWPPVSSSRPGRHLRVLGEQPVGDPEPADRLRGKMGAEGRRGHLHGAVVDLRQPPVERDPALAEAVAVSERPTRLSKFSACSPRYEIGARVGEDRGALLALLEPAADAAPAAVEPAAEHLPGQPLGELGARRAPSGAPPCRGRAALSSVGLRLQHVEVQHPFPRPELAASA